LHLTHGSRDDLTDLRQHQQTLGWLVLTALPEVSALFR
jgi:hypothetical protein